MLSLPFTHVFAGLTLAVSAGVFAAVALVPAPAAVLPLAALICIGGPVVATWHLRHLIGARDPEPVVDLPEV